MKTIFAILIMVVCCHCAFTQEVPQSNEQNLENLALVEEGETEDDSYLLALEQFRQNPIDFNNADEATLQELLILSDLQIQNIIRYRTFLGDFINIYELQAVPSLDIVTIKKILPFITISSEERTGDNLKKRIREGEHSLLLRVSSAVEKSRGFTIVDDRKPYTGSPQRILFRYRYTYKNLFQYGIVGDKDAGESFFRGPQKTGFDFYSFHLFARHTGRFRAIALGDFTVNMGQGLIHWQSLAFKKNVDATVIKRQSAILRPYNSAGEFNFYRGAAATVWVKPVEVTAFISFRSLSANVVPDTVSEEDFISSFLMSGYHRTVSELADRNTIDQFTAGGNIRYKTNRFHAGINAVSYASSHAIRKRDEPYNRYAFSGEKWFNASTDYSYTYKNLHFFGEAAIDKNFNKALLNGLLLSPDARLDISLLYRNISPAYQAVYGNAFTENIYPSNEKGFYTGVTIRPSAQWRLDAYADVFKFPWLKYLVDAPSRGAEYMMQLSFTPSKQVSLYTRYRNEAKEKNDGEAEQATNPLATFVKQNWRTHINYKLSANIELRSRAEIIWYGKKASQKESGFLMFADVLFKPMAKPFQGAARLQYFETDSYDTRLYAYENDVLYSYSIPGFYGKGYRYYLNINYEFRNNLSIWARWAQTVYTDNRQSIGSGLDEIPGKKRSDWKLQLRWIMKK